MKKILLVFLLLVTTIISCRSLRVATATDKSKEKVTVNNVAETLTEANKVVDTTKISDYTYTITEVEFFEHQQDVNNDASIDFGNTSKIEGIKQGVKSIKTTTINKVETDTGKTEDSNSILEKKDEAIISDKDNDIVIKEEIAPDPYRWRYIFYILLVCVIIYIYIRRIPIIDKLKTMFNHIKV